MIAVMVRCQSNIRMVYRPNTRMMYPQSMTEPPTEHDRAPHSRAVEGCRVQGDHLGLCVARWPYPKVRKGVVSV